MYKGGGKKRCWTRQAERSQNNIKGKYPILALRKGIMNVLYNCLLDSLDFLRCNLNQDAQYSCSISITQRTSAEREVVALLLIETVQIELPILSLNINLR